jgi:LysR family transcriptional regulator, low CO2-responsive transcriptional regulator
MSIRHATLHQLKIFGALSDEMSMARTAEALHLTPPAVSIQIRQLADAVGQPLLEQIGKQLYLTDAGEMVAQACRDLFNRIEILEQELAALEKLEKGHIRIATITTAKYFIPRRLGEFSLSHLGAEPTLFVGNRKAVLERLAQNKDDLYVLGHFPDKMRVDSIPFASDRLIAVAHASHPLARKKSIPPAALETEHFILREEGSGIRLATEDFFRKQKCKLNVRMELSSNEAIKQSVMAGLGISILSETTVENSLATGELVQLKVKGLPIERQWYIVHPQNKALSPLAEAFKSYLVSAGIHR